MILIIYAHPYPHHSHANKRMLEQVRTLDNVEIRSLYQLYPDFNIDIAANRRRSLRRSDYLATPDAVVQHTSAPQIVDRQSLSTAGRMVTTGMR